MKENNLPLLSICVAAYNVEPYIEECLNSIKNIEKNYYNKEIIIVNDCSKDKSKDIIQKWINDNKDINVIFIENKKNSGCSGTYHNASKLANGKYITFLDGDDFLIEETFLIKVKMLEENQNLKIVYGNCYTYSKKEGYIKNFQGDLENRFGKTIDKIREFFYTTNPKCSISTSVINLNFFRKIGGFDPNIQINDRVLNIKIMNNIMSEKEIGIVDIPCFAYRMNEGNMTKNYENMVKEQEKILEKYVEEEYKDIGYSNIYYEVSLLYLRENKLKKSLYFLRKSLNKKKTIKRILIFFIYMFIPISIIERIPIAVKKKVFRKIGIGY